MKNPPELTVPSMAAPDASSITARLKPTYRLPLDPKLTAVLIQEKQYGLLETLMNKPQLSPPSGIVNTDDSSNLGNMSLDNLPAEIDTKEQTNPALAMVPVKLSISLSKSSLGKKGLSGILKNIESDVFSTPILESRTRKGIMQSNGKMSGTFMKSSIPSGQEENKIFINKIKTLQAKVNGNQFISVTVIPPKNSKGKKKI